MARKRLMTPKTTNWVVRKVDSNYLSGATVTLAEIFYTRYSGEDVVDATGEDHDDWDFCCQDDLTLQMPADEAPPAGAHIRLTIEQVS